MSTKATGKPEPPKRIRSFVHRDRDRPGLHFELGFMGGESYQYEPPLYQGTTPIERPPKPDYTLNDDLAEQAFAWMRLQKSVAPDKPFFVYWAPGHPRPPPRAQRVVRQIQRSV